MTIDIIDKTVSASKKMHISFHLLMCKNCRVHVKKTHLLVDSLGKLATESEPPEQLLEQLENLPHDDF